jgi:hypothetical protein
MDNLPQFYAAINAGDNITARLKHLNNQMVRHQGNEEMMREIITEILILVGLDTIVMIAYRETLPKQIEQA